MLEYFFNVMFFYYELFAFLLVLGYLICKKSKLKYKNQIYVGVVFVILFVLSAFRYDVGYDYYFGYLPHWRNVRNMPLLDIALNKDHEIGYSITEAITSLISNNLQAIFITTSLIFMILFALYIHKHFPDKVWGVFLLYGLGLYYCSMNFIRQSIAAFIIVFAVMLIKKKKIIPYMLLVMLASTFHKSALIFIPLYFILQIKITKKVLSLYSLATIGILLTSRQIFLFITKFVYQSYSPELTGTFSVFINSGSWWYYIVPSIIYFAIIFIFRERLCRDDKSNNILISCSFFNMFFYLISMNHVILDRFTLYFEPIVALALTELIVMLRNDYKNKDVTDEKIKKQAKLKYIAVVISVVTVVLWSNIRQLYDDGHAVTPYQTIIGNEEYQDYCNAVEEGDLDRMLAYERK